MIFVSAVAPTPSLTVPAGQVFVGQITGDAGGYITPNSSGAGGTDLTKMSAGPVIIGPGYTFNGATSVIGGLTFYNCYVSGILMQNP